MISAFIVGVAAVVLLAWSLRPLVSTATPRWVTADDVTVLLEQKLAVYRSILDLEEDRNVGKVDGGDYVVLRNQAETEAIRILKKIDEAAGYDTLEAEIAQARRQLREGE